MNAIYQESSKVRDNFQNIGDRNVGDRIIKLMGYWRTQIGVTFQQNSNNNAFIIENNRQFSNEIQQIIQLR